MKSLRLLALVLIGALLVGGCVPRFKSYESMTSAVTPDSKDPGQGDKYAYGGTASASGGTKPLASRAATKPTIGGSLN